MKTRLTVLATVLMITASCHSQQQTNAAQSGRPTAQQSSNIPRVKKIITGAENFEAYVHLLKNKKVGVMSNQTGIVHDANSNMIHLVDALLSKGIKVEKIFAPEHGFRGTADAGELV